MNHPCLGVVGLGIHKESLRIVRHDAGACRGRVVQHAHATLEACVGKALPGGGRAQTQGVGACMAGTEE